MTRKEMEKLLTINRHLKTKRDSLVLKNLARVQLKEERVLLRLKSLELKEKQVPNQPERASERVRPPRTLRKVKLRSEDLPANLAS